MKKKVIVLLCTIFSFTILFAQEDKEDICRRKLLENINKDNFEYALENIKCIKSWTLFEGEEEKFIYVDKVINFIMYITSQGIDKVLLDSFYLYSAQAFGVIGDNLFLEKQYQPALLYYFISAEFKKYVLGGRHIQYIIALENLANAYVVLNNYITAIDIYENVLKIRSKNNKMEDWEYIKILHKLAKLYCCVANYTQSEYLYKKALTLIRKNDLEKSNYALLLSGLAEVYYLKGDYIFAELRYQEAMEIYKNEYGMNSLHCTAILNNIALICANLGDYNRAETIFEKIIEIEQDSVEDYKNTAVTMGNLAMVYYEMGKYVQAEELCQKSLLIFESLYGTSNKEYLACLNNLAILYSKKGNYTQAVNLHNDILNIYKKCFHKDSLNIASSLNNLAMVYSNMGNYAEAEKWTVILQSRKTDLPRI